MNAHISDNSTQSLKHYLMTQLLSIYDERESANIVAELFREYLGWNRTDMVLQASRRLSESEILRFHIALKKLMAFEPLQYIIGHTTFCGRKLEVNPSVLIPRPETEELVNHILSGNKRTSPYILDIGTGCGCIAIALKFSLPNAHVEAIDISEEALKTAAVNARGSGTEIHFNHKNILTESLSATYDIIVSNPPYSPLQERDARHAHVVKYEPYEALFVEDSDPLIFYRRIFRLSRKHLSPTGELWCEIHQSKRPELEELLYTEGDVNWRFLKDLQGKDRMVKVWF